MHKMAITAEQYERIVGKDASDPRPLYKTIFWSPGDTVREPVESDTIELKEPPDWVRKYPLTRSIVATVYRVHHCGNAPLLPGCLLLDLKINYVAHEDRP